METRRGSAHLQPFPGVGSVLLEDLKFQSGLWILLRLLWELIYNIPTLTTTHFYQHYYTRQEPLLTDNRKTNKYTCKHVFFSVHLFGSRSILRFRILLFNRNRNIWHCIAIQRIYCIYTACIAQDTGGHMIYLYIYLLLNVISVVLNACCCSVALRQTHASSGHTNTQKKEKTRGLRVFPLWGVDCHDLINFLLLWQL